ncbi:hypothetical protein EFU34_17450 [Vibrio cholerae]|uniref:hypothetical protein n=2 Tax=Vibrio cholerae TaxID=666 RepID=UPI000510F7BD|nr:hypothetical protein [Vibrio cholerae]EGR1024185.1 hypothetical protein [Vibrio cholerae]EGR2538778.1 hypothetical protein [Vibrio cholerae]EGR4170269.1 hypothetical protein [Vibrio cholerae]EGR4321924.1 hypothetical protein [Vibrio cholerae]ORP15654.1 hypothetical protein B7943_10430 [Vibrio cholerae]
MIREFLICFFMGGIPMLLMSVFSSDEKMLLAFSQLSPTDEVVWYMAALLLIYGLLYFIDVYILKTNEKVILTVKTTRSFFRDVGFSILGLYRTVAGAIPTALVILTIENGFRGSLRSVILSTVLFVALLNICVQISRFQAKD